MNRENVLDMTKVISLASALVIGAVYIENRMNDFVTKDEIRIIRETSQVEFDRWVISIMKEQLIVLENREIDNDTLTNDDEKEMNRLKNLIDAHQENITLILDYGKLGYPNYGNGK